MIKSQDVSAQTFGELFRQKRVNLGLTLRKFCELYNFDPGNISRLERNLLPPSLDDEKLAGYATALKIKRDSEEWVFFHDLAHFAKGQIPKDIINQRGSDKYLPLLLRTVGGKRLSKIKLEKIIKLINE
jgi:transcriptional regulator with XRE-family HTH domain